MPTMFLQHKSGHHRLKTLQQFVGCVHLKSPLGLMSFEALYPMFAVFFFVYAFIISLGIV